MSEKQQTAVSIEDIAKVNHQIACATKDQIHIISQIIPSLVARREAATIYHETTSVEQKEQCLRLIVSINETIKRIMGI